MSSPTPIADMVRKMLEKGVAHEAIIMAIEGAELARVSAGVHRTDADKADTKADTAAERRRAYDRERKRNVRGSPLASTGHPRMSADTLSLSKEEEKERERKKESKRGTRLPDKWTPPVDDWVFARDLIGDQRARAELAKFTDHWKQQPGQRGVKLDWSATWRNWVRRAAEYRNGNGKTPGGSLLDSVKRELADLEREDETDPPLYPGHIQRLPR